MRDLIEPLSIRILKDTDLTPTFQPNRKVLKVGYIRGGVGLQTNKSDKEVPNGVVKIMTRPQKSKARLFACMENVVKGRGNEISLAPMMYAHPNNALKTTKGRSRSRL